MISVGIGVNILKCATELVIVDSKLNFKSPDSKRFRCVQISGEYIIGCSQGAILMKMMYIKGINNRS
jgi:hypothetical protein